MPGISTVTDNRRKGDRRQYRSRPTFPLVDSDGNLVKANRRRLVDRRLTKLSEEELEEARHLHKMELRFHGNRQALSPAKSTVSLGRTHLCDIQVLQGPVSREHATLELKDGHIHLVDKSTNGTYVRFNNGDQEFIHQGSMLLHGSGVISLGYSADENLENLIHFESE